MKINFWNKFKKQQLYLTLVQRLDISSNSRKAIKVSVYFKKEVHKIWNRKLQLESDLHCKKSVLISTQFVSNYNTFKC
jgi:hypothetical protein